MAYDIIALHWDILDQVKNSPVVQSSKQNNEDFLVYELEKMSESQLVDFLKVNSIILDQPKFLEIVSNISSAEELLDILVGEHNITFKNERDRDHCYIALVFLWDKWLRSAPCYEIIDMNIHKGYRMQDQWEVEKIKDLWTETVGKIYDFIEDKKMENIELIKEKFESDIELDHWFDDLIALYFLDPEEKNITNARLICNQMISSFPKNIDRLTDVAKKNYAQSYFLLGDAENGDRYFRKWLLDNPSWAKGYIGWANQYILSGHFAKSETILKDGLSKVNDVDKMELYLTLSRVYELSKNNIALAELNIKIEKLNHEQLLEEEKEVEDFYKSQLE